MIAVKLTEVITEIERFKGYLDEDMILRIKIAISRLPTIDAEPIRHGEWIQNRLISTSGGTYGVRRCSLCEAYYQDVGCGWNYCPHCGALMKE